MRLFQHEEPRMETGYNYLILEERTNQSYQVFARFISEGGQGLCFSTTYPHKIMKVYKLVNVRVIWVTEAKAEDSVETVNPKRLQFEMMKIILEFIEANPAPVILIDGFGYLILENGIENVRKFIKKVNDKASMKGGTVLIPVNPSSLSQEVLISLARDFDSMEDMTVKPGSKSTTLEYRRSQELTAVPRIVPPQSQRAGERPSVVPKRMPEPSAAPGQKDHFTRAAEFEIKGDYEDALECYVQECQENPNNPRAWYGRGVVLQVLASLEEAIKCYDEALRLDPQNIDAWTSKGVAYRTLGMDMDALKCYDEALKLNPNDSSLWSKKGITLRALKDPERALECYERALFLSPNDAVIWMNKGIALEMLSRLEEALSCYGQALRIDPENTGAKRRYDALADVMTSKGMEPKSFFE